MQKKKEKKKAKIRKPLAQFIQTYKLCLSMLQSTPNISPQIEL